MDPGGALGPTGVSDVARASELAGTLEGPGVFDPRGFLWTL